jgi:threonine/homoserine/homoserine lactone efflux protein
LFCATETALCFAPGPAVLLVVSQSLSRGARAGWSASFGILAVNAVYFALSATGVGAMLVASSEIFTLIKWLGAGYLIWVGARMMFGRHASGWPSRRMADSAARSAGSSFSLAVFTQGANPKALIFFTAILPQFINPSAAVVPQILILGISSVIIELVVLSIYVATCQTARVWASQPRFADPLERVGGIFLVAAGARLAVISRV